MNSVVSPGPQQLLHKMQEDQVLMSCFPRIFILTQLGCVIPASTASVERGFSTMNLLCTTERSAISNAKLSSLMMNKTTL